MGFSSFKAQSSGGMFVRLGDGDSIRMVTLSEWPCGVQVSYWLDGQPVQGHVEGATPTRQYVSCVFDCDAKDLRVLRLSKGTADALADKEREFGDAKVWRIKRDRKAGKVVYAVDAVADADAALMTRLRSMPPIDVLALPGVEELADGERVATAAPPAPAPGSKGKAQPKARPGALPLREPGDETDDGGIPF